MSRIFLSHSSHDNAQACALRDWLAAHGWDDVFLDLDPRRGLVAGERWQEALKAAADRCEAIVFVVSPAWAASKWCLAEFLLAKSLGKHVFGILVEAVELSELPGEMVGEFQLASLIGPGASEVLTPRVPGSASPVEVRFSKDGLERLHIGLEKAGLDARSFKLDLARPRYPGLRALDTQDAAIFFGRDADIVRGMDLIRRMRASGRRILVVLGASGSGKSSFVRAGLWPRLRRADREFFVLPVVRPEDAALEGSYGLLACLSVAGSGIKRDLADWREMLAKPAGLTTALGELLGVRTAGDAARPLPVLVIDQAEELFHADAGVEATRLLERLAEALRQSSLFAIFSIRSDAYAHLQTAPQLEGIEQVLYSLPQFAQGAVKEVIEGPARREQEELGANALQIDPKLTDRLMRDWSGLDALPLLAFTLERLVHDYGGDGRIDLAEYEGSGGLRGAIEAAVVKALAAAVAAQEISRDATEHEQLLRRAFVPWLVRVDPETRVAGRKMARFERLPNDVRPVVGRLVDAGLLTADLQHVDGGDAKVVEIAHEALLRQWPLLESCIAEQRDALAALEQVKRDAGTWIAAARSEDALLHRGGRLSHVEALLARDELQTELGADGRGYLLACRQRENQAAEQLRAQQERERHQLEKTRRAQRRATVLLTVVALVITAAGWSLVKIARAINQSRSDVLAALAANVYELGQYDRAVRFALSGMAGRNAPFLGFDASAAELELGKASRRTVLRLKLVGHEGSVTWAAFSPDGMHVVTASEDDTARVWDTVTGRELTQLEQHDGSLNIDAIRQARRTRVRFDNQTEERKLLELFGHHSDVSSAVFSHDGTRVVTASQDCTARIWDATTGRELSQLSGHDGPVSSAVFNNDGTRVVTASRDGTARVWDATSGAALAKLEGHRNAVESAAFNHDGTRVVTASWDHTARVWETATGHEMAKLEGHENQVFSAAFNDAGTRIVTASQDYTARVWDAATGREVAKLEGHKDTVISAAFNNDGTRVVTASWDSTARVWDAGTGQELAELKGHRDWLFSAAFSQAGTRVVTASRDETARIWDAATGRELAKLEGHEGTVSSAAFSPDGTRVVTASDDGTARIWATRFVAALHGQDLINAACREVLSVDVNAEPFDGELSHLSQEELQLAPVLNPEIDRDACRPATTWQRIKTIFGWR